MVNFHLNFCLLGKMIFFHFSLSLNLSKLSPSLEPLNVFRTLNFLLRTFSLYLIKGALHVLYTYNQGQSFLLFKFFFCSCLNVKFIHYGSDTTCALQYMIFFNEFYLFTIHLYKGKNLNEFIFRTFSKAILPFDSSLLDIFQMKFTFTNST